MGSEQPIEKQPVNHRPLSDVGMPLLRRQRYAMRGKRVVSMARVGVVAVAGAAGVITIYSLSTDADAGPRTDETPVVDASLAMPQKDDSAQVDTDAVDHGKMVQLPDDTEIVIEGEHSLQRVYQFGQSRGFRFALLDAGLSTQDCVAIENALRPLMDFRRCRPRDRFTVVRDKSQKLLRFRYQANSTEYLEAVRTPQGAFVGSKQKVPVSRERIARGGVVMASLGDALMREGFRRTLVGDFIDVFQGQIRFDTQARVGDVFKVLVDERSIDGKFLDYGPVLAIEYQSQVAGTLRAFYFEAGEENKGYYNAEGRAMHGSWMVTPLRYERISSPFDPHRMHPILKRPKPHYGVDYAAPSGTPVWAAASGRIRFAGMKGANGNLIGIRHENGYETYYAHLLRISSGIRSGVRVKQRQVIGYVGSTGRSTGPHLHFGLKHQGRFIDPLREMHSPGRVMARKHLHAFKRQRKKMQRAIDAIVVNTAGQGAAHVAGRPTAVDSHMD